jgi:phosphomannomutase
MTLITSISGIRGTIGGKPGENLTPPDVVKFTAAYAAWVLSAGHGKCVVVGRDARLSGPQVAALVNATLTSMGLDVIDLGLSTTPTVEMTVVNEKAAGGIIITASHNPKQWNALKLLNNKGEFISAAEGEQLLAAAASGEMEFAQVDALGSISTRPDAIGKHIEQILALPLVNMEAIRAKEYRIVVDAVNSTGGIAVPMLLRALGVRDVIELYCKPDGHFPHNPEPLPEHLTEISALVREKKAHLGIVVDPDVDRLALV